MPLRPHCEHRLYCPHHFSIISLTLVLYDVLTTGCELLIMWDYMNRLQPW